MIARDERPTLKRCPDCNSQMVIRTNGYTGDRFLACSGFPRCRHTEHEPEYLRLRAMGCLPLPGME